MPPPRRPNGSKLLDKLLALLSKGGIKIPKGSLTRKTYPLRKQVVIVFMENSIAYRANFQHPRNIDTFIKKMTKFMRDHPNAILEANEKDDEVAMVIDKENMQPLAWLNSQIEFPERFSVQKPIMSLTALGSLDDDAPETQAPMMAMVATASSPATTTIIPPRPDHNGEGAWRVFEKGVQQETNPSQDRLVHLPEGDDPLFKIMESWIDAESIHEMIDELVGHNEDEENANEMVGVDAYEENLQKILDGAKSEGLID
jgi:hypothetical protein